MKKSQEVEEKGNRLESKMMQVREKLQDVIGFIDGEMSKKKEKKGVEEEIKNMLEGDPSLVYSKDFSEVLGNDSIFTRKIVIDSKKLDNAKEVISREHLQANSEATEE